MIRSSARLLALLILVVVWPNLAAAQPLDQMQQSLVDSQRTVDSLTTAVNRQRALNETLAAAINTLGAQPPESIALRDLQQAQFDVDIARTRLVALDSRVVQQAAAVVALNREIVRNAAEIADRPNDTLAAVVAEAAQELRGRLRLAAGQLLERLREFRALSGETLNLNSERLAVLRDKIQLGAVEGLGSQEANPIVVRLRHLVGDLVQENIRLGNEAAELEATGSADARRISLLRLRADEALLRSNVRLNDIAILEARQVVGGLRSLIDDPAIPVRLFRVGGERLGRVADDLDARVAALAQVEEAVGDIDRIARGNLRAETGDGLDRFLERLGSLRALVRIQQDEIGGLADDAVSVSEALARQAAVRDRALLTARSSARLDPAARERLRAELASLPAAVRSHFAAIFADVAARARDSGPVARVLAAIGALALVALAVYLRQRLLRRFVNSPATQATAVPVEVVRRNLLWLLPAGIWYLVSWAFDISSATTRFLLVLLLIPAAAIFVRDFVQVIVVARADGRRQKIGRLITRLTEFAVFLIAVVAFGYFVVTSVFLLPSTETWIGRLSYGALIIAGLPLLLFAWYFTAAPARGSSTVARRIGFAVLSLLPPVALIGIGVTGIIGYTALATELFINLAQVIIILSVLALALGVLYDVIEAWAAALRARDPARAYFWRRNFLTPLARFLTVVLIFVALRVVQMFFGWTTETPGVGEVITVFDGSLFRFGDTNYTIGRIVTGAAAIWLVFWIASWSRRVSYSLFYVNIRDLGIRQSLSVFTQYIVVVVGLLISLTAIGFDVTTLTVFAASLGVGIGFGMQNVVNNFISGLLLLVERPLRLGDIVTVGGNTGTVEQIGIRSLRLKTFDEYDVIVPNSAVISDTFTNWSRTNKVIRQLMTIGFGYDDDPELAVGIVRGIIEGFEPILKTPAPQVTIDEFADSSINIRVAYYILLGGAVSGFDIRNHVLVSIWKAFREAGITIPYPQRDVHILERTQPDGAGPVAISGADAVAADMPAPAGRQDGMLR